MTDPYVETDDWPTAPATRLHSDAQPVSAPEPSGSTPEAAQGAREALLEAEVAQLRRQWHQECDNFERECNRADVAERERDAALAALASRDTYTEEGGLIVVGQLREQRARAEAAEAEVERLENNLSDLLCDLTGGRLSKTTYDVGTMAQAIEEYFAEDVAEAEAEVEAVGASLSERDRALTACNNDLNRALDLLRATEAESARLASEQRELAAQVAGLRSVVAKVEALADKWRNTPGAFVQHGSVLSSAWREASLSLDAALASVGVSGSADDRREASASQAPDTATPGEAKKRHLHSCFPSDCDHIANRCCIDCCEPGGVIER